MKLLVANRAEIACRVFQSCREMGIGTVGVFTSPDAEARHVTYAEELVEIESYLNGSEIIDAAKRAGAKLIHPGYGFLSENPEFVDEVEKAGLTFVGPDSACMRLMGKKISAKDIVDRLKVPTIPWAKISKMSELKAAAKKVGFPLLLKASAGGGGKGMRKVEKESELQEAADSSMAEAKTAFGDGTLFIERYLEKPRHIEVQVFGFGDGTGVHLHERECSLQRRHQKVWEEAPAPSIPQKTKDGLFESALKLVKETNYRGAGTIEYLVDKKNDYYFLEMNTRLQVEHPVTEMVTGVDLVRAQIELALGKKPKLDILEPRRHSIEVRLYAENPFNSFLPSPGKVEKLSWPTGTGIRVESGIEEGQTITTGFDPMLAKVVVVGNDRAHAIERMRFALDETLLLGLTTNLHYLRSLCDLPAVQKNEVYTRYLEEELKIEDLMPSGELVSEGFDLADSAGVAPTQSGSGKAAHPSPWFGGVS